jgi:hypothetical protein
MGFRECINCEYVSCTLYQRCLLIAEKIVRDPNPTEEQLQLGATIHDGLHDDAEPPCDKEYKQDGLCPCCGCRAVENIPHNQQAAFYYTCDCCEWESEIYYDL